MRVMHHRARITLLAVLAGLLLPVSHAGAETDSALPKGYADSDLPELPPSVAPAGGGDADYADTDPSALTDFREPLDPYGDWVEHETYGTVWMPASSEVGEDFAPYYTEGHWEMTDEGEWLWVSYYDWGYIPYHYGRWVWTSDYGWVWIPGRVYAPAWVVWRVGTVGYIGWAPMPPTYYWVGGVAVTLWAYPPAAYVFCPTAYVYHHHVHKHVVTDPAGVRAAVKGTSPYKPASPKPGGRDYMPAQPSPADAGVSPKAAAAARGDHDPRAQAFAERDGSAGPRKARSLPRKVQRAESGPGTATPSRAVPVRPRSSGAEPGRSARGGSFIYVPPRSSASAGAPSRRVTPSRSIPSRPPTVRMPSRSSGPTFGPRPTSKPKRAAPAPPKRSRPSARPSPSIRPSPPPPTRSSPAPRRSAPPSRGGRR